MIKAVIFDVDGTLVDSNELHALSWQETFCNFGKHVPLSELRPQIGKGADQYLPVFWNSQELKRIGKAMAAFREELFSRKFLRQTKVFPGAKELLEKIRSEGKQLALASSSRSDVITYYVELIGIKDLLNVRTSADEAEKSKPYPDIFSAALGDLGLMPEDAIVVGDTPYDAQAAGHLGLNTIGVLCGGFSEGSLRGAGAIAVYKGPADILAHYDSSPLADAMHPIGAREA